MQNVEQENMFPVQSYHHPSLQQLLHLKQKFQIKNINCIYTSFLINFLPRPKRPNEAVARGDKADTEPMNNNAEPPATTGKETKINSGQVLVKNV